MMFPILKLLAHSGWLAQIEVIQYALPLRNSERLTEAHYGLPALRQPKLPDAPPPLVFRRL
jgi:hypothetical protein